MRILTYYELPNALSVQVIVWLSSNRLSGSIHLIGCSNLKDYHPRGEERIRTCEPFQYLLLYFGPEVFIHEQKIKAFTFNQSLGLDLPIKPYSGITLKLTDTNVMLLFELTNFFFVFIQIIHRYSIYIQFRQDY